MTYVNSFHYYCVNTDTHKLQFVAHTVVSNNYYYC